MAVVAPAAAAAAAAAVAVVGHLLVAVGHWPSAELQRLLMWMRLGITQPWDRSGPVRLAAPVLVQCWLDLHCQSTLWLSVHLSHPAHTAAAAAAAAPDIAHAAAVVLLAAAAAAPDITHATAQVLIVAPQQSHGHMHTNHTTSTQPLQPYNHNMVHGHCDAPVCSNTGAAVTLQLAIGHACLANMFASGIYVASVLCVSPTSGPRLGRQ